MKDQNHRGKERPATLACRWAGLAQSVGLTSRHVEQCPRCQREATEISQLERTLRDAGQAEPEPSPYLHGKIMAGIKRPAQRTAVVPLPWLRVAFAMVLVAILLLVLRKPGQEKHAPILVEQVIPAAQLPTLTLPPRAELRNLASSMERPLMQEWSHVVTDTQTAISALKEEFMPKLALLEQRN